jgi:hypothetical protein
MRRKPWDVLMLFCLLAVWPLGQTACDTSGGGNGSDADSDSDSDSDSDGDGDCADYRSTYPAGPYGTAVGSVFQDPTGLVDGDGNSHNFEELFSDPSIVAIAIANAYDT